MTAQSTCYNTNEIAKILPVDLKQVYEQKTFTRIKATSPSSEKVSKPGYSVPPVISWEYFQNELEFE